MTSTAGFASSSVTAQSWEPHVEDGRATGEVHWLVQSEDGTMSGLWRIGLEEGAEFPYKPEASDTFHAIEGEAELETPDGEKIELVAGGIYSFPAGFTATWRTRSPFLKFFVVA
ncbi:cupin domain-containing protein [Streptomyces sp. R33]|uniref:Cupin domain-containing protein n=1 Tax=Streptomyces sp. R33 TaxID=3238629 RepID=A0AB39YF81_9ACTN